MGVYIDAQLMLLAKNNVTLSEVEGTQPIVIVDKPILSPDSTRFAL